MPSNAKTWIAIAGLALVAAPLAFLLYTKLIPARAVPQPPAAIGKLEPAEKPKPIPTVAFNDANGARHTLAEFRGRYVLLNLWATWCAPCVQELPALAGLQAAVPPGQLTVVAVDVGRGTPADASAFLHAHHAGALPVYIDSDIAFIRVFGAFGLPLSILIDPQGHEVARAMGPGEWDSPQAVQYFKDLKAKS